MERIDPARRVLVVGGGAAGLCAAVAAARAGARVTILEKANRVGKKLLKTGNGRCNLSNVHVAPEGYNRPDFVAPLLRETDCAALRGFFASLGLWTVADGEGRVYPLSDTAASVLDVLRLECARLGAEEVCSAEVTAVAPREGGFAVSTRESGTFAADRVVVAAGGGTALLRPLGHRTVPFSPVLCPLKTDAESVRGLSGLRVRCRAALLKNGREELFSESGEILFRDFGISGILALDLSRLAAAGDAVSLDLLSKTDADSLSGLLEKQRDLRPGGDLLTGVFHRRLAEVVLRRAGTDEPRAVARVIKDYRLTVLGPGDAQNAQVTRGGAAVEDFDPLTLESRIIPGVYCVGEALDVDGRCGGYNLHWAFASGLAAGRSAAA